MSQWTLVDYRCSCGLREYLERREDLADTKRCDVCGEIGDLQIGAPMPRDKTRAVQAVTTGKSDPRPAGMLDTRKLGLDGQSISDWRKERDKEDREWRHQQIKREFG